MNGAENHLRNELQDDERVLWTGPPEVSPLFAWSDLFFIPFAIFILAWGLSPTIWELHRGFRLDPSLLLGWIFFIFVGLYGLFGRFILKILTRRRTFYALTDKRALVLRTFPRKGLVSGYLDEITTMSKDIYRNGRGTITFGNGSTWQTPMGDDFGFGPLTLAFVNVKDVEKIYALVDSAKRIIRGKRLVTETPRRATES